MKNYRVELRHYGAVVQEVETTDIREAKKAYGRWMKWDNSAALVFVDGEQLSLPKANKLMGYNDSDCFQQYDLRKRRTRKKVG